MADLFDEWTEHHPLMTFLASSAIMAACLFGGIWLACLAAAALGIPR